MDNQQGSHEPSNWIKIPGLKGIYTDGEGNIYSTKKVKPYRRLNNSKHIARGRNLYFRVRAGSEQYLAHRLIARVIVGRALFKTEVVNHLDGNTQNNKLSNLEVLTHIENVKHAVKNGLYCSGDDWYEARGMKPSTTRVLIP